MCGILGMFASKGDYRLALQEMHNRGIDSCGVYAKKAHYAKTPNQLPEITDDLIAHLLHSVVGCVAQPIVKKGALIANCEIYNWQELKEKHNLNSKNDAELVLDLLEKIELSKIKTALAELDGVYSFAYWRENTIVIARDLLGVKPLWYSCDHGFNFASERKALYKIGCKEAVELNPRTILQYDTKKKKISTQKRSFFRVLKKRSDPKKTRKLLEDAVRKRLPKKKFGILFSGGVDSAVITKICAQYRKDFICYTAALSEPTMGVAHDLLQAKKVAKELGVTLKIKEVTLKQLEPYLKKIVPLIEDNNVVKVGVALTFYLACELAKKDGIKVIFSGLGSEEIFAGYDRHKKSIEVNKECLAGLRKIYERDLYRDDVLTMNNNLELRLPFLDTKLISHALNLDTKYKLSESQNKIILRSIAQELGISKEIAQTPKKAAQYGSKIDRALLKLSKQAGYKKKSDYLYNFYHPPNVRLAVLWSGGKDSVYAAYTMKNQNYELSCLISLLSKNEDSYMFHTPAMQAVPLQAQAMNLPLVQVQTKGEKEKELIDLKKAIKKAKDLYRIEGVVTGALYSTYQRDRVEKICDELDLKIFSPLWHINQKNEMKALLKEGFEIVLTKIAALGFSPSWLGKTITEKEIAKLEQLHGKYGINVAGEGGEFESLVLDCPLFSQSLKIIKSRVDAENEYTATLNIEKIELTKKNLPE